MRINQSLQLVIIQISLAVVALLIGVLVYLLDRQADRIYFIPHWLAETITGDSFLGAISNHIPTFVHVFAFILLTMAIVVPLQFYRRFLVPVCVFWFSIDSLFEIAQVDAIAHGIAAHAPGWFIGIPFLENTADYFLTGTFDGLDLVSIGLAALAAYYTVGTIYAQYTDHESGENNQ
jgi:hypothetical protein